MSEFNPKTEDKPDEKENPPKVVAGEDDDDDGPDGPAEEEESTATFTPVVHLEAVEVRTHEEEEDAIYKQRAKLFTFGENMLDKGTGKKSWNEKGTGDVKFLKHKENSRIRILMRQEKTMKVIANHIVDPRIELIPNAGASDRSWVWTAYDFSDGELIETTFAIRFGTSEASQEFKTTFLSAKEEMKAFFAGEDSTEGNAEASEAADAIASLSVKPEEGKE